MEPSRVSNVVGFCAPNLPWNATQEQDPTYLLLGGARPKQEQIMSTPFLSPMELDKVATQLQWNSTVKDRMADRYLAVITSVEFGGQTFRFTSKTGTANMDTGGGVLIGVPENVASAYYKQMESRARSLNMSTAFLVREISPNITQQTATYYAYPVQAYLHPALVARTVFPAMTITFRGGAKVTVNAEDMMSMMSGYYSSVVESMANPFLTSIPTAFWPSQPFFRGRYTGFDRKLNALLMTDSLSCRKAKFIEPM